MFVILEGARGLFRIWDSSEERILLERERERDWNREDSFVACLRPFGWLLDRTKRAEEQSFPVKSGRSHSICWLSYSRNCITRSRPRAGECAPFYCLHFPPFSCFSTWWVAGRKDTVSGANRSTIPTTLWRYEWPTHVGGITSASSPSSSIPWVLIYTRIRLSKVY